MSVEEAGVIDCHAHVVLAETMGAAGSYGPEIGDPESDKPWFRVGDYVLDGVRYIGSPFMDPDLRVKRMDVAGISFQILSPNPLTYFHYIPAAEAITFCQKHNDALAAVVAFIGPSQAFVELLAPGLLLGQCLPTAAACL